MMISFGSSACTMAAWIFALLLILLVMTQVRPQPPPGFLNIDCGNFGGADYYSTPVGIIYTPDYNFVEGGRTYVLSRPFSGGVGDDDQQLSLRSFPDGSRNCYTLPSTTGNKYLLRATFTYGNYDKLATSRDGSLFQFGLHIGVNIWDVVNLTNTDPNETMWKEVITIAPSNSVSICLINLGSGIPFISSLQMRPLQDTMYPFVNTSVSVKTFRRLTFGNATENITRYPDDKYDRIWESWPSTVDSSYPWVYLNSSLFLDTSPNIFNLPDAILRTALTIDTNYSSNIGIRVKASPNTEARSLQLLPIFHFIDFTQSNPQRRFDIYSDQDLLFPNFSPVWYDVDSKYQSRQFLHKADAYFFLNKTASSRFPPIINALEVYSLVQMDNLTIDSYDVYRVKFINQLLQLHTQLVQIKYMKDIKTQYNLTLLSWNGDPCSPREYHWEGVTCNHSRGDLNPSIIAVNLSASGLGGGFSITFMNMTSLENLDLSHNNLTGAIPDYRLQSLNVLYLSNNKIHGPVPDSILQRYEAGLLDLRLKGNPICSNVKDTYCSDTPIFLKKKMNKRNTTPIFLIIVIVLVVLIFLLVGMCMLWKTYWKGKLGDNEDYAMYEEETPLHIDVRRFTYAELKLITKNFESIIGKGGFGIVYHGILENGNEVAVKVLMETSLTESTDFLPEVQTLSKVHHKNLVTLQGYCQNKKCLALIYDFMPRGNLQQILRGGEDYSLNWGQRLHIAFDAAQGLEYLHELCTPSIVHRDVKTANILLDKNLVGIISDFGLSRAFNDVHTHISTVVAGTLGYLDPEYHATFQLTVKTDVYSFGIVLLEIVTGQPPIIMDPQTVHLPSWVRQKIAKGSIHDVVDKRLFDKYDFNSLQSVIDLAMKCVENAAIDRPAMTEVVSKLKVWLPEIASEKKCISRTTQYNNSMDTEIRKQFQLLISGVSNEGSSFQSSYTGRMSEISMSSG